MALCEVIAAHETERGVGSGQAATDEASLLAMARESEEGEVLVAPDALIALTKTLLVCEKPDQFFKEKSWLKKENYHCERRPSGPRAAVGAGAEGRVWAVGAQAWSAPR